VYDFLFVIVELFSLALTVEVLLGKTCQERCNQEGVGQFEPRFQGKGSSLGNIFGFDKTRHILLRDSADCTVLRAVVLTQYQRVTDRRMDGIAVAGTALAMQALQRTVKVSVRYCIYKQVFCLGTLSISTNRVAAPSCACSFRTAF